MADNGDPLNPCSAAYIGDQAAEEYGGNQADYERVRPGCECPGCGEDDIDALVWHNGEWVSCENCGRAYQP